MSVEAVLVRSEFAVREPCDVELVIRSDSELVRGDTVELQFPHTWCVIAGPSHTRPLQADNRGAAHFISVTAEEPTAQFEVKIRRRHLPHPAAEPRHGRHIVATLRGGTLQPGAPIRVRYANTFAPYLAESETLWMRVKGQAPSPEPVLTVLPGPAEAVRVLAPSGVEPDEPFDVMVVSLDRYENASATHYENEKLTTLDGKVVGRWLTFTGSTHVRVALPRPGVYRFRFRDSVSNAVVVGEGRRGPYWGDLHVHTKLSHDGQGTDPYAYARDVSGLDFAATAEHAESLGEAGFRQTLQWARQGAIPGRFVTMLGVERNPPEWKPGHHNVYFRDEEAFCSHRTTRPARFFRAEPRGPVMDPARVMLVPHHTGIAFRDLDEHTLGAAVNWDVADDRGLRPLAEIYSMHGQSERYQPQHPLAYEVNRLHNPERRANTSVPGPYYLQEYWRAGRRPGVIGSSDEHSGRPGLRHGGLAAVFAAGPTREDLFDALLARRCYATTGERILLDFTVDGVPMGREIRRPLGAPAELRLSVCGTELLVRVEILRYRFGIDDAFTPLASVFPQPESMDAQVAADDQIEAPCVYYARVTQEPLAWPGMAWSSPVWVDIEEA